MVIGKILTWLRGERNVIQLPDALWHETVSGLTPLKHLSSAEMARLRELTGAFLAEKQFTSAGGLKLTDAMCLSIAVQGCLPILNLGLENYRNWVGIIVYSDEFIVPRSTEDEFGVVHEYNDIASGEAWNGGPVLLSWRDVQLAGTGYNVVIHEFAHKLDMLGDGEADGIPLLPHKLSREKWEKILLSAYRDYCARVDATVESNQDTRFDPYATESPGEFFAVMSEHFFETPEILYKEYPALYEQFTRFYRQNPIQRSGRSCERQTAPSSQPS